MYHDRLAHDQDASAVTTTPPSPPRTPLENLLAGRPSVPVQPGIAARILVTPEQMNTAAKNFAVGQHDLADAWMRLAGALEGAAGMAGGDKAAHAFAARYEAATAVAWKAFDKAIVVLGGTSLGLTQTVNNHIKADHHARADHPTSAPELYPRQQVYPNMSMASAPSVIGPGDFGPLGGIGGHFNALVTKYWPQAHIGKLSAAAAAWRAAAGEVQKVASWLDWTIGTLSDTNDGPDFAAIDGYWRKIYRPGDPHTILTGLYRICTTLADACDRFATITDKARTKVIEKAILAEAEIALTITVVGKALKVALAGIARVTLVAVDAIATRFLAEETIAAVDAAADAAPAIEAVEADFEQTAAKAIDEELEASLARLRPAERDTLARAQQKHPELDLKPVAEERDGEYIDSQGRTYDQMGNPRASQYWSERGARRFEEAIDDHLRKSVDFTMIDLTGFNEQAVSDIRAYVDSLSPEQQAKIVRIGF
jgi:hypothetical protein